MNKVVPQDGAVPIEEETEERFINSKSVARKGGMSAILLLRHEKQNPTPNSRGDGVASFGVGSGFGKFSAPGPPTYGPMQRYGN